MTKRLFVCAVIITAVAAPRLAHAQAGLDAVSPLALDASSTLKGKKDMYAAWRLIDADLTGGGAMGDPVFHSTGWCEGKKDEGVGEYVEIGGDNLSFSRLLIEAGYWKSEALFEKNNRPTALTVIITDHDGNQTDHDIDVPSDMSPAVLDLGETTDVDTFKIIIKSVAKGKVNDTCLSNIEIYDGDTTKIPFLESGAAAQDLLASVGDINTALTGCDVEGLKTMVKFPMAYKSLPDPGGESKPIKTKFKNAKAMMKACKKGGAPGASGDADLSRIGIEGPGKYRWFAGPSNEMGTVTWHLLYSPSPDTPEAGTWQLTAVDY